MAAYIGQPLRLHEFLHAPAHSLIEQAHSPAEALSATVNADGIGVGWYADDGRAAIYRSPLPAWADPNLDGIGRSLVRSTWLANVRSATDPLSNGIANTQPFTDGHLLFLHNGFIEDVARTVRRPLRAELESAHEVRISGTTDSEHLFALLCKHIERHEEMVAGLRAMLNHWHGWLDAAGSGALCNVILADGRHLVALRHGHGHAAPSLYVHARHPAFADGALVASEPLDSDAGWAAVAEDHIACLEAAGHVDTVPL